MATINDNGQSCLEIHGIENREIMIAREDYNIENEYNADHIDSKATDGKVLGKGTGGGHTHWLPQCSTNDTKNMIDYSNFTTTEEPGGCYDKTARQESLARSFYNKENMYSASLVNTSKNEADGQAILSTSRTKPGNC